MNYQRYVSSELTHFVGGVVQPDGSSSSNDDRFDLLANKIIPSGKLLGDPTNPQNPALIAAIEVRTDEEAELGELFSGTRVCFCDITEENLAIHKKKYGGFGLAFKKDFLVKQGACPVFYIEENSFSMVLGPMLEGVKRSAQFKQFSRKYFEFFNKLNDVIAKRHLILSDKDVSKQQREWKDRLGSLDSGNKEVCDFLMAHLFPYIKLFDSSLSEDDPNNYYMEREWRVVGNIDFKMSDVRRVILPEAFVPRFRQQYPSYFGQISFSD